MVHYPGGHEEGWPDGVKNLFIDFYDTVSRRRQGGDEERPRTFASFRDGHYIVLINEAIAQSNSEKVWVNVHDNLG
jgi:predicted dehydrogenase